MNLLSCKKFPTITWQCIGLHHRTWIHGQADGSNQSEDSNWQVTHGSVHVWIERIWRSSISLDYAVFRSNNSSLLVDSVTTVMMRATVQLKWWWQCLVFVWVFPLEAPASPPYVLSIQNILSNSTMHLPLSCSNASPLLILVAKGSLYILNLNGIVSFVYYCDLNYIIKYRSQLGQLGQWSNSKTKECIRLNKHAVWGALTLTAQLRSSLCVCMC